MYICFDNVKNIAEETRYKCELRYNETLRPSPAQPGDLVLVANETKVGPKLRPFRDRWLGPYRVLRRLNDRNILIQDLHNAKKQKIIHVDRTLPLHYLKSEYPNINDDMLENDHDFDNDSGDDLEVAPQRSPPTASENNKYV